MRKVKSKDKQIENPKLFMVVVILLVLSISIILISILSNRKTVVVNSGVVENNTKSEELGGEDSLKDYFDDVSVAVDGSVSNDAFLQTDPFREECGGSGAGENPSISFGTVCFR